MKARDADVTRCGQCGSWVFRPKRELRPCPTCVVAGLRRRIRAVTGG